MSWRFVQLALLSGSLAVLATGCPERPGTKKETKKADEAKPAEKTKSK